MDAEAHAGRGERRPAGRRTRTRRFSTITRSRSSATAPSSCETSSTAGAALAHEVHERVAEQPLRLRVDAGDGLVEHEQLGLARRAPWRSAPAAAARPTARPSGGGAARRARPTSIACVDRVAVGAVGAAPPALLREAAGGDDLLDRGGEIGGEARALRDVPEAPPVAELPRAVARTADRPRGRARADRRAIRRSVDLPEPFGPDEGDELARAHVTGRRRRARGRRRRRRRRRRHGGGAGPSSEIHSHNRVPPV